MIVKIGHKSTKHKIIDKMNYTKIKRWAHQKIPSRNWKDEPHTMRRQHPIMNSNPKYIFKKMLLQIIK